MTYLDFAMGGFGKEVLEGMAQPISVERCNREPEHNQKPKHNTGFAAGLWQSERHDRGWTKTSCLRASSQTKQAKAISVPCNGVRCTPFGSRIPPACVFISALRTNAEKLLQDGATPTQSATLCRDPARLLRQRRGKAIGGFLSLSRRLATTRLQSPTHLPLAPRRPQV